MFARSAALDMPHALHAPHAPGNVLIRTAIEDENHLEATQPTVLCRPQGDRKEALLRTHPASLLHSRRCKWSTRAVSPKEI